MQPSIKRPGPTSIILACFAVSIVFRVGTQGIAFAESVSDKPTEIQQVIEMKPDVDSLISRLMVRQNQLDDREIEIADRMLLLDSVEDRVAVQMAILKQAQEKLASTIAIADSASERDLARLTIVYEKMKAKNAADIFQTMEMTFAAGFLSRMKPEAAAGILSELPADVAYSFSVVMAGRNANAPTE